MDFTAEEWKLIFAAMSYVPDEWLESSVFRSLCHKVRAVRDHQVTHEKLQKEWQEPNPAWTWPEHTTFFLTGNRPEDRSGVQSEKLQRLMPQRPEIKSHDITPEVMNRILRELNDHWDESE